MIQADLAAAFRALHVRGDPLRLYNVWDAGGARAVAGAGAAAVATGSLSLAAAHGYPDGERIPLELVLRVAGRIAASVDLPLSVDIEGGYAVEPQSAARNVVRVIEAGAVGVNVEDGIVGGEGLHGTDAQVARLRAIRAAVPPWAFVNARTDLFLQAGAERHEAIVDEAVERGQGLCRGGGGWVLRARPREPRRDLAHRRRGRAASERHGPAGSAAARRSRAGRSGEGQLGTRPVPRVHGVAGAGGAGRAGVVRFHHAATRRGVLTR